MGELPDLMRLSLPLLEDVVYRDTPGKATVRSSTYSSGTFIQSMDASLVMMRAV